MHAHVRIVAIASATLPAVTLSLGAASAGGASAVREGGTFRIGVFGGGGVATIDPAVGNVLTLVSQRTSCVVVNPYLDLAAVCLR